MKILHSNLSLSSGSSLLKTRYQIQILRQRYEEKFFIDLCILKFLSFLFNKFPLFKSYTRSYSHFSRTNFDDILFSFFLIRLIQTVSCLTLWSDNHQWTSQLLINTLFKYKRKELKGNLGCLKGKSPDSHLLRVFKKVFLVAHSSGLV